MSSTIVLVRIITNQIYMKYQPKYGKELEKVLLKIRSSKLLHELLIDLTSPGEYKELAVRWQIVKMLKKGLPHRTISKKLGVSVATITRGSREMSNKKGGFQLLLLKRKNRLN